ncbi:MAG: choice-of-anchor D domain-containing protein [Prevotella sp.]|nr:choice-of-anchor D domain-containing protein [Prevotella sp.]
MKRFFYLLTAALLMAGVGTASADTVTEGFEDWGTTVADGWTLINGATYGNSYSYDYVVGSDDFTPAAGSKCLANSSHSAAQGTTASPMIVTPALSGTVTFQFRKYNSSNSTKGYINIFEYDEASGQAIGSSLWTCRPNGVEEATSKYQTGSLAIGDTPKRLAIYLAKVSFDEFTYTPAAAPAEGPSLAVSGYKNGETVSFGMVNPGSTKTLTLTNPGTAEVNVNIAATGGYTAAPTSLKIASKATAQLTITVPDATAEGTLTLTPVETGIETITLNLSCTVKDPAKMFEDFSGLSLPEDWETAGVGEYTTGSYATSYVWEFSAGYAAYKFSAQSESSATPYFHSLITPRMAFGENEKMLFKIKKNVQFASYIGVLYVEYSADKTTWTTATNGYFASETITSEWQDCEVTIPASAKYVRFRAAGIAIDDVYGGTISTIPMPKLEVVGYANGSTLSWGFADVPAGTEKTITLRNSGKAELNATIAATNDFTLSATTATIAAGETFDLTIGTPAHDGNGTLTITPQAESGLQPYTLTLTSYYKVPKAVMELDKRTIAFGKLYADATETVTVQNTGDARLTVAIANNNTDRFEATPAQLTVEAGESQLLTIKYKHDAAKSGTYTATFTLTPNDGSAQTITATATNKRQGVWSEDFEEGIPTAWTNDGWTIGRKWNEASSVNHAYAGYNSGYLITPRLKAEKDEELSFDFVGSYATLKVEYASTLDAANWTLFNEFEEDSTITFKAPEAGTYYLRFSGSGSYLDNFEGFQLDQLAADAAIIASSLPATGNQFAVYNASVTVQNKGSQAQTVVARLLVNGSAKDTKETALAIEGTTKIDLSFTPETALENAVARIEVTLKGVSSFAAKTVETTLNVAPAPTLDETVAPELATGTLPVVTLKYTAANGWNTIAVPFALNDDILTRLFGADYEVYEFKSYANDTIKMHAPTMFVAGYAYLVYARNAVAQPDGIALENIRIETTTPKYDASNGVQFTATFAPMAAGELTDKYTVALGQPLLVKGTEESTLNGFRAYFTLGESITKAPELAFYTANGIPTSITLAKTPTTAAPEGIYNLKGMRVTTMQRGLYIVNGKKVLVK